MALNKKLINYKSKLKIINKNILLIQRMKKFKRMMNYLMKRLIN